jgi:hypothetical protein
MQRVFRLSMAMLGFVLPARAAFHYFDPTQPANAPALLSQTGIYANIQSKTLDTAAKAFEVNAPLWSDGAVKKRWIILKPGQHIPYNDTADYFDYPDSTVFVKNFSLVRAPGDTVYWETRLLIRKRDAGPEPVDWYGFSYRWNAAQTDASLVPPGKGLDTVFFATDARGRRSYKKWRFPSQGNCNSCHIGRGDPTNPAPLQYGRGVLGFFPAQLKRPSAKTVGSDQVLDLFNQGVFAGTRPTAAELARRFRGVHEPLAAGLSASQRYAAIDTMARSYIAANCSGCHGARGNAFHATGEVSLNYDFQNLKPQMDFGMHNVGDRGLFDDVPYDTNEVTDPPKGRAYYRLALADWGIPTTAGKWNMALPSTSAKVLIYPGYASASTLLFRQWVRKSPWTDSGVVARALKYDIQFADAPQKAAAEQRRAWYFSRPWGSQAWQDTLSKHGLTMDSLTALVNLSSGGFYSGDGDQMPPLATFQPDTAALQVLAEWVQGYKETFVGIHRGPRAAFAIEPAIQPAIRDRILVLPAEWRGPVQMLDIRGRAYGLTPLSASPMAGRRYALPGDLPRGVYAFRAGARFFRATVL